VTTNNTTCIGETQKFNIVAQNEAIMAADLERQVTRTSHVNNPH
jgi:hypothetical protein